MSVGLMAAGDQPRPPVLGAATRRALLPLPCTSSQNWGQPLTLQVLGSGVGSPAHCGVPSGHALQAERRTPCQAHLGEGQRARTGPPGTQPQTTMLPICTALRCNGWRAGGWARRVAGRLAEWQAGQAGQRQHWDPLTNYSQKGTGSMLWSPACRRHRSAGQGAGQH